MSNEKMRTLLGPNGDLYANVPDLRTLVLTALDQLVAPVPTPGPIPTPAKVLSYLRIESTSDQVQTNVHFTAGQVFAPGDLPAGSFLEGLQLDVKATHPDGSVRHALVSGVLPMIGPLGVETIELAVADKAPSGEVESKFIPGLVRVMIDGVRYTARNSAPVVRDWMKGNVVNEYHTPSPFMSDDGLRHPHLMARFAARCYAGERTRFDVAIENNWAYEPDPQNFTYDVEIEIAGEVVHAQDNLTHFHHARWRNLYWVGGEPQIHIKHDVAYLIASRALPNYDRSVKMRETTLAGYVKNWNDANVAPMKIGPFVQRAMATTGGRNDIGILPGWAAAYLISQDERAKRVTIGVSNLAGSWSIHYRDQNTDQPISVIDFPRMTLLGNPGDTLNRLTGKREAFPVLSSKANPSPYSPDAAHQPNFSYLPYLVTGDHYHLEELQFWAQYNIFRSNPGFRGGALGLVHSEQIRGQAWSLRSVLDAAYITPDNDRLKKHFNQILYNNIIAYSANYLEGGPLHNKLGVLTKGAAATGYKDGTDEPMPKTAAAPWQDDFNTAVWGMVVERGYMDAEPMFLWKARFPIGRMVGDGVCWMAGANYTYVVRATEDGPIYETFAEAYRDTVGEATAALGCGDEAAAALENKPNDMGGYSSSATGFPSNMQPALAYAATTSEAGLRAWRQFMARGIKPDYGISPQFAILPRDAQ